MNGIIAASRRTNSVPVDIIIMSNSSANSTDACNSLANVTRYISGGDSTPSNGDVIYTNSNGTDVFNGGNNFYISDDLLVFKVNSSGVISGTSLCGV